MKVSEIKYERYTIEQAKAVNGDFDALEKGEKALAALLDRQSAMDDLAVSLEKARKAQGLLPDEALMRSNALAVENQRRELTQAVEARSSAEKALPEAEARRQEAEAHAPEADALLAQARQLSDCIPVLKALERQRKSLTRQEAELAGLLEASNRADIAYAAAKDGYYRSQAGLLAAQLEDGKPCPVCGALSHPRPAQLTEASVTKEALEAADKAHRDAADALHAADNALTALRADVGKDAARLREMGIEEAETQRHLQQRIDALNARARQYRDAIDAGRQACNQLTVELEKSRTAVEQGQRSLSGLLTAGEQLQAQFAKRLRAAGFEDEQAYQLAKLADSAVNELEDTLRKFGEQKASLLDQTAALREKLSGKERIDLSGLEGQLQDWKAKKKAAEAAEAALVRKLALHEDALREIQRALRQKQRKEEHWAVVRDLYNCCAGIAGGNRRAKLTFEAYVQQYYFKQVVSAANKRLTVLTDGLFTLRCKEEARDRVRQSGLDLDVLDRGTGQWRDVSTLSGGESFLASLALALGLSDVVQAQSGAIRMDAMFIDEGFGTLDDNALRNSLQVLADLADGKRLIGIISHVRDLEERIEKQIVVSKTPTGSRIDLLA